MKITSVETLLCSGGWRPWQFVKIQTDEGITGYGECSNGRTPKGIAGTVADLSPFLVGHDPRRIELLNGEMYKRIRQCPGGVAQTAVAGIDAALWDIKAKALGVPVYALVGGPTREKVQLYWSHCGTYRMRFSEVLGTAPIRSLHDINTLGREVVARGFTALKTNILLPESSVGVYEPGFGASPSCVHDLNLTPYLLRQIEALVGTFREAVGRDVEIALDLNFNFRPEGFARIARALEPFDLMWLELDTYDPATLRHIKDSTKTRICSGENLFTARAYRPFFDLHAMDVAIVDVAWNGFTGAKKIVDMADVFEINCAPHIYYSHLSMLMSAHLCAATSNVRILEYDVDDVPWKDDLITEPLCIADGHLTIPNRPGWGADLNEEALAQHPWSE
jgi:L-alanine-DL-glutamate epimerase-like enolase superfamily enzyme